MTETAFDFLTRCRPGMTLMTRDRRRATITAVDAAAELITGAVPMLGACTWRSDGRYAAAPAGAAGPLDLMPPGAAADTTAQSRASLATALQDPDRDGNPGCCD
jgi:hypothetical protein